MKNVIQGIALAFLLAAPWTLAANKTESYLHSNTKRSIATGAAISTALAIGFAGKYINWLNQPTSQTLFNIT